MNVSLNILILLNASGSVELNVFKLALCAGSAKKFGFSDSYSNKHKCLSFDGGWDCTVACFGKDTFS